jgi:hypothetical protein
MKLHLRVIDAAEGLLGWAEVFAYAKGDGQLWVRDAVVVVPDVSGVAATLSVQWVDLNVEARSAMAPTAVAAGVPLVAWPAGPIFRVGPQAGGLPPVTVKTSVALAVPVGSLAGVGSR